MTRRYICAVLITMVTVWMATMFMGMINSFYELPKSYMIADMIFNGVSAILMFGSAIVLGTYDQRQWDRERKERQGKAGDRNPPPSESSGAMWDGLDSATVVCSIRATRFYMGCSQPRSTSSFVLSHWGKRF